ncbi:squalene--hopene cyclase [Tepidibacillus marianensis]|uniref:squalene--hopene cyclase n=1 Tax=Tepidibacillus marianensis TaxID=3131995 RepID=UPI0030CAB7C8
MKGQIQQQINRLVQTLEENQGKNGSWNYCFENSTFADAYMIILLRILDIKDETLIKTLVSRLKSQQTQDGTWKLYLDEGKGNLSATTEAYYALLYSGYVNPNEPQMRMAKQFICEQRGLASASLYTKVMLALTGQYPWPENLKVPMELILLPPSIPFNIFDFVGYARVHFVPIMVCANKKFSIKTENTPDLSDLYFLKNANLFAEIRSELPRVTIEGLKELTELANPRSLAYKRAEEFMLQRIEKDGTLYNYFSATILMIFALLALGYAKDSNVITRAVNGLKTFTCKTEQSVTIQNSPSNIWDTALISYALQESGIPATNPIIQKSTTFLLSKQQRKYRDWILHNPRVLPGGWGFSNNNSLNPDVDDTTAALRAIQPSIAYHPATLQAWQKGVRWTISMQNRDGGWPAFEKDTNKKYTQLLPIKGVDTVTTDPSSADLTGRTLEFLGNYVHLKLNHPSIQRGVRWLLNNQEKDGSWYGRWGISYIYGTWAAITGLKAVGVTSNHLSIQKTAQWLLTIQNPDGGWGESCKSDRDKHYVALHASTPSQTAWALDTLISIYDRPIPAIQKGMEALLKLVNENDWRTIYPTGAGFPGNFYIHYHSYRYIWPLLALGHYKKKYSE